MLELIRGVDPDSPALVCLTEHLRLHQLRVYPGS